MWIGGWNSERVVEEGLTLSRDWSTGACGEGVKYNPSDEGKPTR